MGAIAEPGQTPPEGVITYHSISCVCDTCLWADYGLADLIDGGYNQRERPVVFQMEPLEW